MTHVSPQRRLDILDALRRGAVPARGLEVLAVGLKRFEEAIDEELDRVARGQAIFKAVRGEYGTGKTFFARWLQGRARRRGFATTEVQVSESQTRLHKMQTVYRAAMQRLRTESAPPSALPDVVDRWLYELRRRATDEADPDEKPEAFGDALEQRLEDALADMTRTTPQFAAALRTYRRALADDDLEVAHGLLGWLAGNTNVGSRIKREADIKGELDHHAALECLGSLLTLLRQAGYEGLVLVLDEVETLQRVRSDVREKSLNALRQLVDYLDEGRFPGLYVLVTGTPAFFEGPQGVQRLPPLAQRLHTDFSAPARFDNPRAVQLRLQGLDHDQLVELGWTVRDLYAEGADHPSRIRDRADDNYLKTLADAVAGEFGGDVRVAPRLFLKKLVADVLDRIEQFEDFDPRQHYEWTVEAEEMTAEERRQADSVDDIDLELED